MTGICRCNHQKKGSFGERSFLSIHAEKKKKTKHCKKMKHPSLPPPHPLQRMLIVCTMALSCEGEHVCVKPSFIQGGPFTLKLASKGVLYNMKIITYKEERNKKKIKTGYNVYTNLQIKYCCHVVILIFSNNNFFLFR